MKKFNLFKEIIVTDKQSLLNAINSSKVFGINIDGEIVFEPFREKEILIYKGQHSIEKNSLLMKPKVKTLSEMMGSNYQIVEDGDRVLIKAFSNWQELIGVNTPRASYDDTTADGVAEFANKELEEIGWYATDFNIKYRPLVELLEDKCDGTLLCIEQEEPYQFSGLGFLSDDKQAQEIMFEYCQNIIKDIIDNDDDYAVENLDEDELKAAKFFKLA